MNKLNLLLFLLLIPILGFSQSLERSLIGSASHQKQSASVHLDWSVGETMVTYLDNSEASLSQGLNQWIKLLTGIYKPPAWSEEISLSPNPFINVLNLKSETSRMYNIELYSIEGKLIDKLEWDGNDKSLNLSYLNNGTYLVFFKDNKGNYTAQKIIKHN